MIKTIVAFIVVTLLVMMLLSGCTRPDHATQVLADNGYTNIQITGYSFFGCPKDDHFSTGFTATAPNGRTVSGAVCEGWITGAHIRID